MISNLKNTFSKLSRIWRDEEEGQMVVRPTSEASFHVVYNDLEIGTLSLKNGAWIFDYSKNFKLQSQIRPIVDFPNKDKVYTSDQLWPFFASRIPGLGQPQVKHFLEKNDSKEADAVLLLREFGKKSIANPFELVPA